MDGGGTWARKLHWLHSRRLDRLQTAIVLPTARSLYLAGSLLCVVLVVLALLVAAYFQLSSWRGADTMPVPEATLPAAAEPTLDRVAQRLQGPTGIRFAVDLDGEAVGEGTGLGHFEAEAANGPAAYPDDFQIVGGRDAELFNLIYDPRSGHAGLGATAALAKVAAAGPKGRRYVVRVLAHDAAGNRSQPTDVSFAIEPGAPAQSPAAADAPVTDLGGAGTLPRIARAIALHVAPGPGTPEYFDTYKIALAEPDRCDAGQAEAFVGLYRHAFVQFRSRLTGGNLASFLAGVCESWKDAQDRSRQAAAESERQHDEALAQNAMAREAAASRSAMARLLRNAALGFAFTAILAFMTIALFLAFLAIEGHSAAVRQVVEMLASERSPRDDRLPSA